jgi:hypothetical protein
VRGDDFHRTLVQILNRARRDARQRRERRLRDLKRPHHFEPLEARYVLNGIPVAIPDPFYSTALNTNLTTNSGTGVVANDFDAEGSTLSASVITGPANGSLSSFNSNGSFTYVPDTDFQGLDSFTYRVSDGTANSNTVNVQVVVGTGFGGRRNLDERVGDNMLHTGILKLYQPLTAGLNLVFRSEHYGMPIVPVEAALHWYSGTPTSIKASLTFDGEAGSQAIYTDLTNLVSGDPLRFALNANGIPATGMYDWSMTLEAFFGETSINRTYSGKQAVVNRADSPFGPGWWLEGLDQLFVYSDGALLVEGDGRTFWFKHNGTNYNRAEGDLSFATLTDSGSQFEVVDKWGHKRVFNAAGYLTFGRETHFRYDGTNTIEEVEDSTGRICEIEHNTNGDITSVTQALETQGRKLARRLVIRLTPQAA